MAPKNSDMIARVKSKLASACSMVDIGPISFHLGLKIERDQGKRAIKLLQPAYIDKIFSRFHFDKANAVAIPMNKSAILKTKTEDQASKAERERNQRMIGSIMFLMVETRPDVTLATSVTSRFAKPPGHQHMEEVKTILKYLKRTRDRGITYGGLDQEDFLVKSYSDSDWTSDKESRKLTSGFIFMLNNGPVS